MTAISGDVGFVHNTDFADRVIQWAQARKYGKKSIEARFNHCFLITDDVGGLIQATPSGVEQGRLEDYSNVAYEVRHPPYTTGQASTAVIAMRELLGTKYGWPTIVSEVLTFLTGAKLRFGLSGTEICSGAVSYALTRGGVDVGQDGMFNSPADVMHYAVQQNWIVV